MQNAIAEVEKIPGKADDLTRRRLQERALEVPHLVIAVTRMAGYCANRGICTWQPVTGG